MKSTRITWAVIGTLFLAYGIYAVMSLGTDNIGNFAFIFVAAVFYLLAAAWKRIIDISYAKLGVFFMVMTIVFVLFAMDEYKFGIYGTADPQPGASWVVMIGEKSDSVITDKEMNARIELTAQYLKDNPGAKVVAPSDEAGAALIADGIASSRIVYEKNSDNIRDNFLKSLDTIVNNGGSRDDKIVLISTKYNLYRLSLYANREKLYDYSIVGSSSELALVPQHYFHEFGSYFMSKIKSHYKIVD